MFFTRFLYNQNIKKGKNMLYENRQFYSSNKNKRRLSRYFKRCWKKIWDFNGKNGKNTKKSFVNERWIRWKNNGKVCYIERKSVYHLTNDGNKNRIAKNTKKCVIRQKPKFKNCGSYLE